MAAPNQKIAELERLLWRMRDGVIDDDGLARIESLVTGDAAVRRHYIRYSTLCGGLRWINDRGQGSGVGGQSTKISSDSPPIITTLPTTHYPLPTTFVGGPVFSYMVATVVLCLMLLGGWAYKITHNSNDITANSRRSTISGPSDQPEFIVVGRITGTKDCRWSDPDTQTVVGASVSLDRQYALSSGLLEVTYKSGARVILEGPCTYKVDSDAGGYLERGKLTARVETKGSGFGVQGSKVAKQKFSNPQSLIPNPFIIRTPTALVTDLGTEFGVEVDENGDTTSYVFQGSISVQGLAASAASGAAQEGKVLHKNESIRVSRVRETHQGQKPQEQVRFMHLTVPPEFVREMPPIQMRSGSMPMLDSAAFAWKYEMDADPTEQDLDGNSVNDWTSVHTENISFDGLMHMKQATDGNHGIYWSNNGDGTIWSNISHATGFTFEIRLKSAGTRTWHEYTGVTYLRLTDENLDENFSDLVIANEATLWDNMAKDVIDTNANDDDYHVFRVAQQPNSRTYHVWRDGKLIYTRNGLREKGGSPANINCLYFGDMSNAAGPCNVDYIRLTPGAYAPPSDESKTTKDKQGGSSFSETR